MLAKKVHEAQLRFWDIVISIKSGTIIPTSLISKLLFKPLSNISKTNLGKIIDLIITRYDDKKTDKYALMIHHLPNPYTGVSGYFNDSVPCELCDNPQYIAFEDTQFMVYSDPIRDLIHRYGKDYWKPYPEEKRLSKHGIIAYNLSDDLQKHLLI